MKGQSICSSTLLLLGQIKDQFSLMGNCCTISSTLFLNPHFFVCAWLGQSSTGLLEMMKRAKNSPKVGFEI